MKKNIVIIEDDASNRELAKMTLSGAGFQVFAANSIRDGAKVLDQVKADFLVCDYNLPDGIGTQLVANLKTSNPIYRKLPVLMLTIEDGENKKEEGKASGVSAWMVKPFKPSTLLKTVESLI